MTKFTDEQIIKALEYCSTDVRENTCPKCAFYKKHRCSTLMLNAVSDIINRQKAEIKRLGTELDLSKSFHKEAVAERNFYYHQMIRFENMFKTAKSEAIKEFAERLKRTSVGLEIGDDKKFKMTIVSTVAIDNLVKEMTEEEK